MGLLFLRGARNVHTLNIIVSKTDTLIGAGIRLVLGGKYNHTSIAFDYNFDLIYSFTRRYKYIWISGCFCKESLSRFEEYTVFSLGISDKEYAKINKFLQILEKHYRIYNYVSALCLYFNKSAPTRLSFTCSTFTAYILSLTDNYKLEKDFKVYTPMLIFEELMSNDCKYDKYNRELVNKTHIV